MEAKDNLKLLVKVGSERFNIPPEKITFVEDGQEITLGDLLAKVVDLDAEVAELNRKLEAYIKVEAEAQKLIANAHDALSLKVTKLEEEIKVLKEDK